MKDPYNFEKQQKLGTIYEDCVRRYLQYQKGWFIQRVDKKKTQKCGIDFFGTTPEGQRWSGEIKADYKAHDTDNLFIETWSIWSDNPKIENVRGWAFTSLAQLLFYGIVEEGLVYVINMAQLREEVVKWLELKTYKEVSSPNDGYSSKGLLVPQAVFEAWCRPDHIISDIEFVF